jgi:hypothetical protein
VNGILTKESIMKKILMILSALTLLSYGCNRDEPVSDPGVQREERFEDINQDYETPGAAMEESEAEMDAQREEVRPENRDYRAEDADVTAPIDDRPNLEEEE